MIQGSRRLAVVGLFILALSSTCFVTPTSAQDNEADNSKQLLEDFIHYVLIARPDLADGAARALLDSGITDADLYRLSDEVDPARYKDALLRSMRMDALSDVAGQLDVHVRRGRQDVARDYDEIARNIALLVSNARAKQMAREALRSAGEYAVPQLLHAITSPSTSQVMKTEARSMLVIIKRQAVTPLCAALPNLDPVSQERVCQILGEIQYPHAIPTLHDLATDTSTQPAVKSAASRAVERLGGDLSADSRALWHALAEEYWAEAQSLVAWPGEETANVWDYDTQNGLYPTSVPLDIFGEVMAMRSTATALQRNPESLDSLGLWIAANFRRSDQLDKEASDPTYAAGRRAPMFYAVLAGPNAGQNVLARANRDLNTQLARHAIASLNDTAGGANLWAADGQPSPLIGALTFPERRVRYDAALALGAALPANGFAGAERVIPILANTIRTGGERFAAVIAQSPEDQRTMAANLRNMGFSVLPPRSDYRELATDLIGTVGIDLFAIMLPTSELEGAVSSIQHDPRVSASPVMLMVPGSDERTTSQAFAGQRQVGVMRLGLNEAQSTNAILNLVEANVGTLITADEADRYAAKALQTLRDIAVSNTSAFDVSQAAPALVEALDNYTGDLRMTAAITLSWIDTAECQQALLRAALRESDEFDQLILLGLTSDSARRFGSQVSDSQIRRLATLVHDATGPTATAAAQTHGALDLPASSAVPFILD